ncbi:MAG: M20/M25/M40 family metallo-hydrolase, partial [Alphaproteobacteria bacterium]|nr:M20/M25/M40 family metallo-hydrolase [Alphaproteobacteria bacterium]
DTAALERVRDTIVALAEEIAARRRVTFELGDCVGSDPTPLDPGLRGRLVASAQALGLAAHEMPTVGHDASIFQRAGIPAAMVLVRNQHGSHNPHEAMEMADFGAGTRLLAAAVLEVA